MTTEQLAVAKRRHRQLLAEQTALNDKAGAESRDFTAEEQAQWDTRKAEMESVLDDIAAHEARNKPEVRIFTEIHSDLPERRIPGVEYHERGPAIVDRSYRSVFGLREQRHLETSGFKSSEEFLLAVRSGLADPRLSALQQRAMSALVGSDGGFLVPQEWGATWMDKSLENEVIRPGATVWPMASQTRTVPAFGTSSHVSHLFGGVVAHWGAPGKELDETAPEYRQIELKSNKLSIFTSGEAELVQDAGSGFADTLTMAMTGAMGWFMDDGFINGHGVGMPLGLLNDPSMIAVAKEGSQTASTIVYKNLTKMFSRMHPACRQNAIWVINNTSIPQLLELTIPIGTGGSHIPVMTESNGEFRILTRPVVFTEKAAPLGSLGDVIFVDRSQYVIGMREELTIDFSDHVYFRNHKRAFRAISRLDGRGSWKGPLTPKNGDTLSWVVTLAARA